MMELLHAGFDTFDVAFQGALDRETLDKLKAAREEAAARQEKQLTTIGPGLVEAHVESHGIRGGYAFVLDTGPVGEKWFIKENSNPSQWNIRVSPHAATLAALGYDGLKAQLAERLSAMGAQVGRESIGRVDFAMDFLMPQTFDLKHEQFVAHRRSKVRPHWGKAKEVLTEAEISAIFRGRSLESVTIGKMPGRQIIVYDKRQAAIEKKTPFWFKVWDIDPKDRSKNIWRVEFRAGKKELKERWQISSFADFETAIGDVFRYMADRVRYVDDFQSDSNISRQRLHPLWQAATATLEQDLLQFRSGLLPDQVREVERERLIETYYGQIQGIAAGLSIALGISEEEARETYGRAVGATLANMIDHPDTTFFESREKAARRLCFITNDDADQASPESSE